MGFVDISVPGFSSSPLKTAFKENLDDGVDYGSDGHSGESQKAAYIKNMWVRNGVLTSRKNFKDVGFDGMAGEFHSAVSCFGQEIVHCGTSLYGVDENGCRVLYNGIPDSHSFFVEFSGKLYLYCNICVFSVDRDLNIKEELPYCPVFEGKCNSGSGMIFNSDKITPNILAPFAKVYYQYTSNNNSRIHLPENIDMSKKFFLYKSEELLDESQYSLDGNYIILNNDSKPGSEDTMSICFYSTAKTFEKCGIIGKCTSGIAYGGNLADGTRIICGGNPDYCGRYFMSELSNPLHFSESSYGIAGSGSEDITAFSKQHSELLIFTENTICRMKYNYTSENGGYYSVHLVSPGIGCDMPGSVMTLENRTVFANSEKGVYVVDTTDGFDVMNVLSISANINDCTGEKGFFSVDKNSRKHGLSVIYDRKYLLYMGDKVFVLDLGVCSLESGMRNEKKFSWFELDGFDGTLQMFSFSDVLYVLKRCADGALVERLDGDGKIQECVYRSAGSDLDYPFNSKYVTAFRFEYKAEKNGEFELVFFADGKKYFHTKAVSYTGEDGYGRFYVKLPKISARHFAFEIRTLSADTGVMNVGIDYRLCKKAALMRW